LLKFIPSLKLHIISAQSAKGGLQLLLVHWVVARCLADVGTPASQF